MKLRRILSCLMALLLVCSLPVSVLADTWYLEDGSITVSATESGQTVSQGSTSKDDDAPVITQRDSETATGNTVTIKAAENATANVTMQDVNIVISDPTGAPEDHSGEAAVTIDVADGAEANVTLDGVNINTENTGGSYHKPGFGAAYHSGEAAVQITGNGDVTLELDGDNILQSGYWRAGVEKNTIAPTDTDSGSGNGKLTITDENGKDGSLKSTGGFNGSGIGGGYRGSGSNITITGSAEVTAQGGFSGSGIGGGLLGDGSNITIEGNAEVIATGGENGSGIGGGSTGIGSNITITGSAEVTVTGGIYGAGIGGGYTESGSEITISGSAQVEATGGMHGAGIGGGYSGGTGSNITVSEDAQVKAQGGSSYQLGHNYYGAGAAIGDGGKYSNSSPDNIAGDEVEPNTNDLNEGWIATYTPGTTDLDTATPNSLTYMDDNNTLQTATENIVEIGANAPTCTEDGHEAGFSVDGTVVAVTIPATDHNVPGGYTPLNNATCTTLGTMEGYCTDCKTMVTVPDPNSKLKDHTFTTYVPDPNNLATCTEAGTKTAVCDVCHKATNTVIDPAKDHSMGTPYTTKEPTCQEEGVSRRDCDNCDYYETEPIGIADHSYGDYVSDNNATCTEDGTKTRNCIWCGLPDTVPDPGTMLRHQFTNYVSDGNATCTEDGTKTAQCDHSCGKTDTVTDEGSALRHQFTNYVSDGNATCTEDGTKTAECDHGCGKTDTVTDEGSALGHSFTNYVSDGNATYTEDGTKTAQCDHEGCGETDTVTDEGSKLPFYLVKDEGGRRIPCQVQKQDGVLTITVDADFAILTGTLGGMQALKGQGVDTIVFVTGGATSTFAIEDLLAQGSAASTYMLTHDGEAVTFTLGTDADISKILK